MKKFLDYITKDSQGQTYWAMFFGLAGTVIAGAMSYVMWNPEVSLYMNIGPALSVPIGFLCVYLLGIRKNSGNVLGFIANINETAVNIVFGNFGFVVSAIYYGFSHIIGFFDWRKNSNSKGEADLRDISRQKGLGTLIVFLLIGTVFVFANWYYHWLGDVSLNSPTFWANIFILYGGIVAQGLMVLRYRSAWWVWFTLNLVAVPLQFASGNYVFGVMYIFYEINCILTLYAQYTTEMDTDAVKPVTAYALDNMMYHTILPHKEDFNVEDTKQLQEQIEELKSQKRYCVIRYSQLRKITKLLSEKRYVPTPELLSFRVGEVIENCTVAKNHQGFILDIDAFADFLELDTTEIYDIMTIKSLEV